MILIPKKIVRYTITNTAVNLTTRNVPPRLGRDALLGLVSWMQRRTRHDLSDRSSVDGTHYRAEETPDRPSEPDGATPAPDRHAQGGVDP